MQNMTTIKLELGVAAQKITSMLQLNETAVNAEIEKGVNAAIAELLEGDNLANKVKEQMLQSLSNIVSASVSSWELKHKVQKMISDKAGEAIEKHVDVIAAKLIENLNK